MTIAKKVSHSAKSALFTLYKEGLFYKCYNQNVLVFVIKVKNYKVSSKICQKLELGGVILRKIWTLHGFEV
jgi:hypothetical protein